MMALQIAGFAAYAMIGGGVGWVTWELDDEDCKVGILAALSGLVWPISLPIATGAWLGSRIIDAVEASRERRRVEAARQRVAMAEVDRELRLLGGGRP